MNSRNTAQDIFRCHLCESPFPPLYCDICNVNLCKVCVGEHLLDGSDEHKVVPIKLRRSTPSYPRCQKHGTRQCELYCEQCDIPICANCVSSEHHEAHKKVDILEKFQRTKESIQTSLQELEKSILIQYQKFASEIPIQISQIYINSDKLTTSLVELGENLHKAVDTLINRRKSEITNTYSKLLADLANHEREITKHISEIEQTVFDLNKLLDSNDMSLVCAYKFRGAEFKALPQQIQCNFPCFSPLINTEQLYELFGFLFTCNKEKRQVQKKYIIEKPHANIAIVTEFKSLFSVACLSEEEVWTCGNNGEIKLYNLHGDLLKSIQTKSECAPSDIAVTRSGDLVYTDRNNETLNIVKEGNAHVEIKLQGWRPVNVCTTSSADLLVTMISNNCRQARVVRYSGSLQIQIIQYDDKGKSLYSTDHTKYISENRNLDVCVADNGAHSVVVVDHTGKFRFKYTGPLAFTKKLFDPVGITTDSQGRILTTDFDNACIHVLDQDGQFLCHIDNCGLCYPWGLCVDTNDNLFVADDRSRIKKIQYSK